MQKKFPSEGVYSKILLFGRQTNLAIAGYKFHIHDICILLVFRLTSVQILLWRRTGA
jgi:hypothetical protein